MISMQFYYIRSLNIAYYFRAMPFLETNVYNSFIHTCTVIHRANLKNISVSPYLTWFPWYGSVGQILFLSSQISNALNLIVNTCRSSPTVIILSFRTDRSGQTVQTQTRLLLEEQSDQRSGSALFAFPFATF